MRRSKKNGLINKAKRYKDYFYLFISIFLIISLIRNISRIRSSGERIEEAQQRVDNMKEEQQQLKNELDSIQSDIYIETQLRDGLGLAREDEIVIVLPEDEILRRIAPEIELEGEEDIEDNPNWKKWLEVFYLLE